MLGKLIALSKNGEEKGSLPVVNLHFFIGSDLFCDLRINHKDIAAQHCLITSQKNKPALIRNLSRTVPTLVNSTEIGSSDVELKDNDIISIRHKNYKWCYDSLSTPSTSSQTSFVVSSKNRKSWPLFKNKLVAVVTPQRRDEHNEVPPRKRRGTVAEENISKSKSTPKVLAIKSGLRATTKRKSGKRKSNVKVSQNIVPIERTPNLLPSLTRKSVKFLDLSGPRSRLGTRGRNSSYATPYKSTPAKQKVSVYSTPPSSFGHDKKKRIKSILKTPSSSSTTPTPRKDEYDEQRLLSTSDILATPLSNVPEVSLDSPSLVDNELLLTPEKGNQPEIVMRSSKRKAALVRSPPSTPKSITKKRKSPEEKSIEASERAAKKLKQGPPHAIDKKKRAALLQCHRKSLTPHPLVRRSGKLITSFPSSFSHRLEINSPVRTKLSTKYNDSRILESLKLPPDSQTPTTFKYTDSQIILDKTKTGSRKKSSKSFSKETSPIFRKFTRASRAARISNSLPQKTEATDVLSALDLSRRWPSPLQGEASANSSSQDVSYLSGIKKLFSVDKALDVRELFLENNSESDVVSEKSFQSFPETLSGRVSRHSAVSKGKQSTDKDEFMHSFQSEGAQDLPCSTSLLSGSLSSFPSYSSTSRRSLSLKHGRKSTLSPKDINSSLVKHTTQEERSSLENITTQSSSNKNEYVKVTSTSVSRKGRRSLNALNASSFENKHLVESSNPRSANESHKNSVDKNDFSDMLSKDNFGDCDDNMKDLNDSSLDASGFSLGSFNSSYYKSRTGDSLSLSQTSDVNAVGKETFLENSTKSEIAKDVRVKTPITGKAHPKGRISLRRAVLLASTPKPGKVLYNNESLLSLELEGDTKEKSIHKSGSYKLRMNRSRSITADVSSMKLRKIINKGKGFIAKTSSRSASLPSTIESTILKDLSAISTSIGNLRTSRCNKVNWNGSPKSSKKLINSNKTSPVSASSSIQSTNLFESVITDHSHQEVQPELASLLNISGRSKRSQRKTEGSKISYRTQIDNSPSSTLSSSNKHSARDVNSTPDFSISSAVNISLGKRGRPSKHKVELSQLEASTSGKTNFQNVQLVVEKQAASKQNLSILEHSGSSRRSNRTTNSSKIFVETQEDISTFPLVNKSLEKQDILSKPSISPNSSQSSPLKKLSRSLSHLTENVLLLRSSRKADTSPSITPTMPDKESSGTPIIKASSDTSIGRRGRPSKHSVAMRTSQIDKYIVKKRSRSLPSSSDGLVTRKKDTIILNVSRPLSPATLTLHYKTGSGKEDSVTPTVNVSSNISTGRRGRPSKLSVAMRNSQLEKSIVKKRSQSSPSSSDDLVTPKQDSSILEDSKLTRRSNRKVDHSKAHIDSSPLSPATLHDKSGSRKEDNATPIIIASSATSIGRRGRTSKLSVTINDSLFEKTIVKKRSRSLPSSSVDLVTPKQDLGVVEDYRLSRRRSRIGDDSKAHIDSSPLSPSTLHDKAGSVKEDSATPTINVSSNTRGYSSNSRRGRPSKLSVAINDSQLEISIVKKRSQSLPSSSDDLVTPKQDSSVTEDSRLSRRSSRKGDDRKVLNKTNTDTSPLSPLTLHNITGSGKEDSATPTVNISSNTSIGRRGRPSKLSVAMRNSQIEKSIVEKRSRSLSSSSDDLVTPKQDSSILEDSRLSRRSSRKGDDSKVLNKTNTDTSPLTLHDKTGSGKEDSATPTISVSSNARTGRRGRPSKLSVAINDSQLEISIVKKRSQSLPSSSDDLVTPKQDSSVTEDSRLTRRSSRKGDGSKVLNKINTDTSPLSPLTLHDITGSGKEDSAIPTINVSSNARTGRRGRPSKLSVAINDSQLEISIVKKRSQSLPSSSDDLVTPKQDSSVTEDSRLTRRSSRKGDGSKVLNKINTDTSPLSPLTLHDITGSGKEDSAIPTVNISSNTSIGRRGRPSKLSVAMRNSQIEKSIVEKRSRSLSSLSDDLVTPNQDSSVLDDSRLTRSSRKGDGSKVLNKTNTDTSPLSPLISHDKTGSGKEDSATPTVNVSSNTSIGRRGRPSKLSVAMRNSQIEKSIVEKRSRSLSSSSDDLVTPKQDSSILEDSRLSRRSSRKGDDSKVLNKTNTDTSSLSPLTLHDKTGSGKEDSATPTINVSSNTRTGRRGRPSKLRVAINDSQLEISIVKKRSQSLPSSSDDLVTPKQESSVLEDSKLTRRSNRKDDSKAHIDSFPLSPATLHDKSGSGKEDSATPTINVSSNTRTGRRGRPYKLSVAINDSQLVKSIVKKRSQSSPSSSDDLVTPKQDSSILEDSKLTRRSSIEDYSKVLNKTRTGSSFLSPSRAADKSKRIPSAIITSSNTSIGTRVRSSELTDGFDNLQLEKVIKKSSGSLPITPEMPSSVISDNGQTRRSSRIGDVSKTLERSSTGEEVYTTPSISTLSSVITSKNKQATESKLDLVTEISPLKNVTDLKLRSRSLLSSTTSKQASDILENSGHSKKKGDGGKKLNKNDTQKSKKRKVGEATPELETSGLLLNGSSSNNISSPAKKKVKICKSEHSKTFGAFSSTPIVTKNPYLVGRSIEKNRSRLKFRSMQSPMGLSPIIGSHEKDCLVSDQSTEVSMICLRNLKCPSVIEEGSKSDSLVISSSKNKISLKVSRSHNSVNLYVTDSSNYGTNNSKVQVGKKKSTRLFTSQNELPFMNQTPVTSELPSEKKNKSLQLPSTARKSGCSIHSLQDSKKDKMIDITPHLRSKTPVIKLTPGKSRTRSRKIKDRGKKSIEEKKALSENRSSKREAENSEATDLQNELISNLKRPSADNKTVNKIILSSPKTSERDVSTVISPIPKRKGRPPKVKVIVDMKNSTNNSLPVSQRRGRSAKNNNLSPLQKSAEAPLQKMSKKNKGRKTIVAEDPSSSFKGYEIRNLRSVTDQLSENTEQKSPTSFPKTRSKVAVLALRTPRKSILIASPIVKSPALNRRRVGKIKSENILSSPHAQKQGESAKEDNVNVTSGAQNHSSSIGQGRKRKQNLSPLQNHVNIEKTIINLSSPIKRRGRSAIHNSSNKKENPIATSPHFPKRGRLKKVQDDVNISRKGKDLNKVIEEASTLPLQKRGRSAVKSSDSSTKKRKSKKDLLNNNETSDPLSLPKRGRSAKIQESNLSVSGKAKDRKISESVEGTNISLRRGRSVVKSSDSSRNKKGKPEKDQVNSNETISSPSLPKKGRPRKVQDSIISVSGKGKDRKTSERVEGTNTSLRRGRSVVKSSDSSHNKKGKSEKDRVNNNETISSPSLPQKGRTVNRVQESATTDSRKKLNKKNSEIEELQTNRRRGRSAVEDLLPSPAKQKRPIESEGDGNFSVDSPLPKRGRPKRVTRNTSEKSTGDQNTLPLQKRGRPVVANSDSSPVKRGKSKKDPTGANVVVTSPSIPKRGRTAKGHDVTASMKDSSNKDLKSISPKQKIGRSLSVAVGEERKKKSKQNTEKTTVNQSSSKKGRPAVSENISPRSLSAALKNTSPKLLKRKQVTTKPPGRRGNLASSPQVEIRKVSERSKAIKKSSKTKDIRPLKSAIKESLSKRLLRKSSSIGFINHGRRKVHFNNYVARSSNAKKK